MPDNLTAAAAAAGLTPEEKKAMETLSTTLSVHRELSNLPQNVAQQAYANKTPTQQQALQTLAPKTPQQRGWLGNLWHYTIGGAFGVAQELSDLTTRAYRAAVIPIAERGQIGFAWNEANDKGDKVFNTKRIDTAKARYGDARTAVALRVAQGEKLSDIAATGSLEERTIAAAAAQKQDVLFQDALDEVNAAKYSPGRQLANFVDLVTPGDLVKSGFAYKALSGSVDALWRIKMDPTLGLSKVKKAIDVSRYAVDIVVGQNKVDEVFARPQVQAFWNQYGEALDTYKTARDKGASTLEAIAAKNRLKTLAPEFGDAVVNSFLKADVPVTNALTAKAFFQNAKQVDEMMAGQVGRKRVMIPKLDASRKARVLAVTTANKIFDLDRMGSSFVDNLFFGGASTTDGIKEQLINGQKDIVEMVKANDNPKGVARFSTAMIQRRIDKAKAKFTGIPSFDDNLLDVTSKDAADKVFRYARLVLPQRESKMIAEAFDASEVGAKKEIFYGLQQTIADIRGLSITKEGRKIYEPLTGKTPAQFALTDANGYNPAKLANGEQVALILSDNSNYVTTLSLRDLDRAAARSGLIQRMAGLAHSNWVEKMTSAWSFATLAGPRYALRNAAEDLMVHIAIGESPFGLVKGRMLSTRLRTAKQLEAGLTDFEKAAANPLGGVMRFVNKRESKSYAQAIEAAGNDVVKIRQITAQALNEGKLARFYDRVGMKKLAEEDKALLSEQILHGNLDNALMDVVEGGKNAFKGFDAYTRTLNFARENKVRTAELKYNLPSNLRRAKGKMGFTRLDPVADEASQAAWAMRIGYYANDKLGGIAVANLDNREKAIDLLKKWLKDNKDTKEVKAFRMEENGVTLDEHAERIYDAAHQLFVKGEWVKGQTDNINLNLLNKVRTPVKKEVDLTIPKGFKFKYYSPSESGLSFKSYLINEVGLNKQMANQALSAHNIVLTDDAGKYVGHISWAEKDGTIKLVNVTPEMQRKGFATKLFNKAEASANDSIKAPLHSADKSPEGELWAKSLGKTEYRISGSIGLDDLPNTIEEAPSWIVGPQLVPVSDTGNYATSLMEWGWDWLGEANARFSREPMVLNEMIKLRKQMRSSGFEQAFIDSYKRGITDAQKLQKAELEAKRRLAEVVEDRARLQTLAYVDNPAIQSQMAFSIRNFARFYRATEDFYRRMYRVVRYNPEAIARASLTYEGVTHSGWVQKDDQGNDYFLFPGTEYAYRAVQGVMQALGVPAEFKVPFPVQFGAQLKMITPSLNPDSAIPTLAGPLSGVSVKVLSNIVSIFSKGAGDQITGTLLGKYAVDQPMVSAFLPGHINRIYSAMNQNERDGQYASAWRKAVTYLEASGNGLKQRYDSDGNPIPFTAAELEDYRQKVENSTKSILGLRVVYGFLAPATPQVQLKSDMAQWVRGNGEASFKQVWYGLMDKYGNPDDAYREWVKLYPKQMPFTVSESERSTVAYFRYAKESGDFVDANQQLFKDYPQGAAFMIPHKAGFSWDAYKTMTDNGLRRNKRVEDFLREVQTAADMQIYYAKKNDYENSLQNVSTDFERKQLRDEFQAWATTFKAGRPLVQEELAQGGKRAIERNNALNDLEIMLNSGAADKADPKTAGALRKMVNLYTSYKLSQSELENLSRNQFLARMNKDETILQMRELAKFNENTQNAYNVLFGRLLGD